MTFQPHRTAPSDPDQETAIGLVWGYLNVRQFRSAATLAHACLALWPGQPLLLLLGAYAAAELGEPPAAPGAALLRQPPYAAVSKLLLHRAGRHA